MGNIVSIDLRALLLSPAVFIRITLPDPPPDPILKEQVRALLQDLRPAEVRQVLTRASKLAEYTQAVKEAIAEIATPSTRKR
jgi:hypothetical protein